MRVHELMLAGLLAGGLTPAALAAPSGAATGSDAQVFLKAFLRPGADVAALGKQLRPSKADYAAVFTPEAAKALEEMYSQLWDVGLIEVKADADATELLLWSATTEDIAAWKGAAAAHFPAGYKGIAKHLQPGRTFYTFKFVKPGTTLGLAWDGLTYVNGQWRIFPQPWTGLAK